MKTNPKTLPIPRRQEHATEDPKLRCWSQHEVE